MVERESIWGLPVRAALIVALSALGARVSRAQEVAPVVEPGTVSGTVVDKTARTPIIEAGVEVVGQKKTVRTDLDGRYSIKLPPGTYELRISAPSYQEARLKNVAVKTGAVTKADASLVAGTGGAAGVDVVEVYAKRKKAAEASALTERKEAPVVKDTISRETMAKTTGSEASDLVQRAPAVTVKDDRFVFVRGLSERYTSALLNGSRLPSPDPLRRAVPLDLFPADFLDSIGIVKSFSPDLPGDFSGGLVELNLRDLPDQLTYSFGASMGANTQTTFQDFPTYHGTNWDYVGLGEDYRALSPPARLLSDPYEGRFNVAKGWHDIWSPTNIKAPPNFGANFAVGNRFGPVGFQLGALYSNEWTTKLRQINRQFGNNGSPDAPIIGIRDDLLANTGQYQAKLGGVLTTGYQINNDHELAFRAFVYQNAVDRTTTQRGILDQDKRVRLAFLQYVPENLAYGQLSGEHRFTSWFHFDWRTVLSRTTRDEPDTRFSQYYFLAEQNRYVFSSDKNRGGLRISNSTEEWLSDTMGDFTIPFDTALPFTDVWDGLPAKFKFGPAYAYRAREFEQREFLMRPSLAAIEDPSAPPETILAPNNLAPGIVDVEELTDIEDRFTASQEIMAAYGLFELPIVRDRLRVTGGARVEYSLIRLDTGLIASIVGDCPVAGEAECRARFKKKTVDPLPGMSLIYSPINDMNVRLAYGESVARPEFRELAPARFPTPPGERSKRGNPDLVQTEIKSYDVRWEWFFSPLEIASVGFFYKELAAPIEQVTYIAGTTATDTWVNGGDATLIGVEIEGRKDFGFIHQRLRPFSMLTNVTWSDSSVTVPNQRLRGATTLTNPAERTLVGQSPFIVNGGIEYTDPERLTARLLYYTAGRSINSAGFNGLDDIFFERRDQLDGVLIVPLKRWLGVPISAKFAAENVLNSPFVFTQGPVVLQRYTNGVKFTLGFTYSH